MPELYHTPLAGPGDRPPGSATAMLRTASTKSNVASLCIRSALAAKTRITAISPLHVTQTRGKGVYSFFPEFQLLDQYNRVLRRVQAPGGSLGTSRGYLSSSRHPDEHCRGKTLAIAVLLTTSSKENVFVFFLRRTQPGNGQVFGPDPLHLIYVFILISRCCTDYAGSPKAWNEEGYSLTI